MAYPLFFFFSSLAVISALLVILLPHPTRALLSLVITMFSLAVLFLQLGAYFLAMAHLIVYAGAILVLFLFVIMLQGIGAKDVPLKNRFEATYLFLATFVGLAFLALIVFLGTLSFFPEAKGIQGSIENFGTSLFQNYLLPFELVSVLLLLGVFAAIALAKKDKAAA